MLSFFGTEFVPASQVPFPGEPSGEPGNGTWRAGTTLYRRNDSVGFFFSPVTIKLLQRIRTKTSFDQFCIRFIRIYRLLWSNYWPITDVISKPKVKVVEHDRDEFIPCLMWSDIFSLSHYKIKEIARVRNLDWSPFAFIPTGHDSSSMGVPSKNASKLKQIIQWAAAMTNNYQLVHYSKYAQPRGLQSDISFAIQISEVKRKSGITHCWIELWCGIWWSCLSADCWYSNGY